MALSFAPGSHFETAVHGEIDMAAEREFRELLADVGGRETPVIDLANVSFIDSSGLRQILDAAARASREGKVLVIRNPSLPVRHLFELALPRDVPGLRVEQLAEGGGHRG